MTEVIDSTVEKRTPRRSLIAAFLGITVISLMSGAFIALIFSAYTKYYYKLGILVLLVGAGFLLANATYQVVKQSEGEPYRTVVWKLTTIMAVVLICPTAVFAALFGII